MAFFELQCCKHVKAHGEEEFYPIRKNSTSVLSYRLTQMAILGGWCTMKVLDDIFVSLHSDTGTPSNLRSAHQTLRGLSVTIQFPFALPTWSCFSKDSPNPSCFTQGSQSLSLLLRCVSLSVSSNIISVQVPCTETASVPFCTITLNCSLLLWKISC